MNNVLYHTYTLPLSCSSRMVYALCPNMRVSDPARLRCKPDQRQKSNLGKTFGLRMDRIYVTKLLPLGLLELGPRDQVTSQNRWHEAMYVLSVDSITTTSNNVALLYHSSVLCYSKSAPAPPNSSP